MRPVTRATDSNGSKKAEGSVIEQESTFGAKIPLAGSVGTDQSKEIDAILMP